MALQISLRDRKIYQLEGKGENLNEWLEELTVLEVRELSQKVIENLDDVRER